MTSRLTPILPLLLLLLADSAPGLDLPQATVPLPHANSSALIGLHMDKHRAHYDFENCGKPTTGRARRGFGDDYVDGVDFEVDDAATTSVEPGKLPWAVAILTRVPGLPARLCAGTLVSRRHVLSAAHCLSSSVEIPATFGHARCKTTDHIELQEFMAHSLVKYGGECLNGADSSCDASMLTKEAKIKKITLFPFFREDCSRGSDLVIFELDQDVDVPHACLPHLNDVSIKQNSTFHTFKWQADKSKGVGSAQRLQRVAKLQLRQNRCARKWRSLSPDVLCAAPAKHIAQCLGESGAGLLTVWGGRAFLVGVLSSSSECAPEAPDVPESRFTDVRLFSSTIDRELMTVGPLPDFSDVARDQRSKPENDVIVDKKSKGPVKPKSA